MSLREWINIDKLDLYNLSINNNSIKFLEKNKELIGMRYH